MRDFDPTASEFITSGYLARSRPGGQFYDMGSIIQVGAQLIGADMGANAAKSAANTQADAANRSTQIQKQIADEQIALQREQYNQARADQAPFRQVGLDATNRLAGMMAGGQFDRRFTAGDMNADPVYQSGLKFGLDQGTQGINRQAAAGGSFLSGATLKALTRYGNDYGSTKANESYNRFNNDQTTQYNRYAGLAGTGQQATNQIAAAGQNMVNGASGALGAYGSGAASNAIGAGNARASGYMGQANAWSNGIGNVMNAYQQNKMMDMFKGEPYGSGGSIDMSSYQG